MLKFVNYLTKRIKKRFKNRKFFWELNKITLKIAAIRKDIENRKKGQKKPCQKSLDRDKTKNKHYEQTLSLIKFVNYINDKMMFS